MTDGGDVPYGMDGEENVGGINKPTIGRRNTLLVPMIEEVDEDSISPSKDIAEEETKENWEL
jgi:hypothetical protein